MRRLLAHDCHPLLSHHRVRRSIPHTSPLLPHRRLFFSGNARGPSLRRISTLGPAVVATTLTVLALTFNVASSHSTPDTLSGVLPASPSHDDVSLGRTGSSSASSRRRPSLTSSSPPTTPPPPPLPSSPPPSQSASASTSHHLHTHEALPEEEAVLAFAPEVPPPISRKHPALVRVALTTDSAVAPLTNQYKYEFWRFNGHCPGPFIRVRVGDVLELTLKNDDPSLAPHNIDLHSVIGPGGGSPVTNAEYHEMRTARFKMLYPGLFIYHCAAAPVPLHIANGMYGLILVEPEAGLPPVDREYYVMRSEFYLEEPGLAGERVATSSYPQGMKEDPDAVVFNGREGALLGSGMLKANVGERVRIFYGNAGPNQVSTFHVIGAIFDVLHRDGDLISPPARGVQAALTGPGSAAVVEFIPFVPGTYTLVDHAIFRMDKGCVGFLTAVGEKNEEIYSSTEAPKPCVGCKLHP